MTLAELIVRHDDAHPGALDSDMEVPAALWASLATLARIETGATVWRVALIGCGKEKRAIPSPARDLYTGSLFRAALGYATQPGRFDEVLVLSAKHGVLTLDQTVAPYDADLTRASTRRYWGRPAAEGLRLHFLHQGKVDFTFLAGQAYVEGITDNLDVWAHGRRPTWSNPLLGMGVGQRRGWFARQVAL